MVIARRIRAAAEPLPAGLTLEALDKLVAGVQTAADFPIVWLQLQKAMAERVLKAELTHHLGYPEGEERELDGNARTGDLARRLPTECGPRRPRHPARSCRKLSAVIRAQMRAAHSGLRRDGAHAIRAWLEYPRAPGVSRGALAGTRLARVDRDDNE